MRRALLALTVIAAVSSGTALAGSLSVSPTGLDLPSGQAAATVTVRNGEAAPMTVQVRVFQWRQVGGEDRLEPTTAVVVSPPIATLDPRSEQLVRVVRIAPAAGTEESFRLIVDELPPPPDADGRQIRLLMRHSIPLFFAPPAKGRPQMSWRTAADADAVVLIGRNDGARRLRLSGVRLLDANGGVIVDRPGLLGYVLPGAEAQWRIPAPAGRRDVRPTRLSAETDAGPIDVSLSPAA